MDLITPQNMMPKAESSTSNMDIMMHRQSQEVQAAVFMAKQFPRDEYAAFDRIMKSCERLSLAEVALYEYPRGGQKVMGPSIRLAEAIAKAWGNIDSGIIELEQKNGQSSMLAYAWDLETNTRSTKTFIVKHERKAKGNLNALDDPRDVYELTANMGARRVRACLLAIIPGDVVDAAVSKVRETLKKGYTEPLEDRIRKMVEAFRKDFQVTKEMIEKLIGCKADAFSDNDFIRLRSIYVSLRDNLAKREDYFDLPKVESASPLSLEGDNDGTAQE